jgi:hypothetical protein
MWSNNALPVEPQKLVDKLDLPPIAVYMWRTTMAYRFGGALCLGCTKLIPPDSDHMCYADGSYYTITYLGGPNG